MSSERHQDAHGEAVVGRYLALEEACQCLVLQPDALASRRAICRLLQPDDCRAFRPGSLARGLA